MDKLRVGSVIEFTCNATEKVEALGGVFQGIAQMEIIGILVGHVNAFERMTIH